MIVFPSEDVEIFSSGHLLTLLLAQLVGDVLKPLHLRHQLLDVEVPELHQRLHLIPGYVVQHTPTVSDSRAALPSPGISTLFFRE